jgi:hypothetical protein
MLYLCDTWFHPDGGVTAQYVSDVGHDLRLLFYIDQLYSPVAHQLQDLHRRVLTGWWSEDTLDPAGRATSIWAINCVGRHWRCALDPGTMIFHHRRLATVFWCPESVPTLWRATSTTNPAPQPRSPSWRAQIKAFRIIRDNRRKCWLKAVSVVLLYGFNRQKGSTDVASIIVQLLEQWAAHQYEDPHTYARYFLDEAVEDALYGASVSYPPGKRPRLELQ